jgi:hypothetical protein
VVSGPGLVDDGPLTTVNNYVSPVLRASGPAAPDVWVFVSFAGGPTPSEIDALILAQFDPATCNGDFTCIFLLSTQRDAFQPRAFAAVAIAAEVPLPPALPLFVSVLGLIGWLGRRQTRARST